MIAIWPNLLFVVKKWWLESTNLIEGESGRSTLDPRRWPLSVWRQMGNVDYYFALSRAYGLSAHKKAIDTDKLIENFNKFLQAAKEEAQV